MFRCVCSVVGKRYPSSLGTVRQVFGRHREGGENYISWQVVSRRVEMSYRKKSCGSWHTSFWVTNLWVTERSEIWQYRLRKQWYYRILKFACQSYVHEFKIGEKVSAFSIRVWVAVKVLLTHLQLCSMSSYSFLQNTEFNVQNMVKRSFVAFGITLFRPNVSYSKYSIIIIYINMWMYYLIFIVLTIIRSSSKTDYFF